MRKRKTKSIVIIFFLCLFAEIVGCNQPVTEKVEITVIHGWGSTESEHVAMRQIYEDFVLNDLSLGEIASEEGISRQGVHDLVKRCSKKLQDYENKLHLVEKFLNIKEDVGQIHELAKQFKESSDENILMDIETISNKILEEL